MRIFIAFYLSIVLCCFQTVHANSHEGSQAIAFVSFVNVAIIGAAVIVFKSIDVPEQGSEQSLEKLEPGPWLLAKIWQNRIVTYGLGALAVAIGVQGARMVYAQGAFSME